MKPFASRFALLALSLGVAGFAAPAFAQDSAPAGSSSASTGTPRHADPQRQAARLTKRLGLSDDQSSKIATILQNRQQQMEALRGDSSLSPQDRRAKMRSIQRDSDTQINSVLTPAQQTQYANMKQQLRERMQNSRNGGGQGNGGESSSGGGN
ncbi:MAG TPA: hypothetical protein VME63_08845 [Dyella sp.]|uniref:hypothetical protein n=1 Tax=Dyella sp. TaxID=1869338 RepID=UPI002C7647D1|nr:hypothetical protein [Dyella sp.]HTV85501.1 hypothetical protein [Dyella sp.]